MLFPLEIPAEFEKKTVKIDEGQIENQIIQSKQVKVRASISKYKIQRNLTIMQAQVYREKYS